MRRIVPTPGRLLAAGALLVALLAAPGCGGAPSAPAGDPAPGGEAKTPKTPLKKVSRTPR
jgi:hypothetical protein